LLNEKHRFTLNKRDDKSTSSFHRTEGESLTCSLATGRGIFQGGEKRVSSQEKRRKKEKNTRLFQCNTFLGEEGRGVLF